MAASRHDILINITSSAEKAAKSLSAISTAFRESSNAAKAATAQFQTFGNVAGNSVAKNITSTAEYSKTIRHVGEVMQKMGVTSRSTFDMLSTNQQRVNKYTNQLNESLIKTSTEGFGGFSKSTRAVTLALVGMHDYMRMLAAEEGDVVVATSEFADASWLGASSLQQLGTIAQKIETNFRTLSVEERNVAEATLISNAALMDQESKLALTTSQVDALINSAKNEAMAFRESAKAEQAAAKQLETTQKAAAKAVGMTRQAVERACASQLKDARAKLQHVGATGKDTTATMNYIKAQQSVLTSETASTKAREYAIRAINAKVKAMVQHTIVSKEEAAALKEMQTTSATAAKAVDATRRAVERACRIQQQDIKDKLQEAGATNQVVQSVMRLVREQQKVITSENSSSAARRQAIATIEEKVAASIKEAEADRRAREEQEKLNTAMASLSKIAGVAAKAVSPVTNLLGRTALNVTKTFVPGVAKAAGVTSTLSAAMGKLRYNLFSVLFLSSMVGMAYKALYGEASNMVEQLHQLDVAFKELKVSTNQDSVAQFIPQEFSYYAYDAASGVRTLTTETMTLTEYMDRLAKSWDVNSIEITRGVAQFKSMFNAMSIASAEAEKMAINIEGLAFDMASLWDVDTDTAVQKFQSALAGQTRAVRQFGLDVTEASLVAEANLEGFAISSIDNLSRADKSILIYNAMIRQSTDAQGDWARSMNTPANQVRRLKENLKTAAQAMGALFIPLLKPCIVLLNVMAKVAYQAAEAIAALFGHDITSMIQEMADLGSAFSETSDSTSIDMTEAADAIDSVADSTNDATEAAKEFEKQILGFDEINNLQPPKDTTDTDTSGTDTSGLGDLGVVPLDYTLTFGDPSQIIENQILDKLKAAIVGDDWTGVGELLGSKLYDALCTIPWKTLQKAAGDLGRHLAQVINGFTSVHMDEKGFVSLGYKLGESLANMLMIGVNFAYEFVKTLDFAQIGRFIGQAITGYFENMDFGKIGYIIGAWVGGIISLFTNAFFNVDWGVVLKSVVDGIGGFFAGLWDKAGVGGYIVVFVALAVKAFQGLTALVSIASSVVETVGVAFRGLTTIREVVSSALSSVGEVFTKFGKWLGTVFEVPLNSVKKAFTTVGSGIASVAKTAGGKIKTAFAAMGTAISNVGSKNIPVLSSGITKMKSGLSSATTGIGKAATSVKTFALSLSAGQIAAIALAAALVAALVVALVKVIQRHQECTRKTTELADACGTLSLKSQTTSTALQDNAKAIESDALAAQNASLSVDEFNKHHQELATQIRKTNDEANGNIGMLNSFATALQNYLGVADLTATQEAELRAAVEMLNEQLGKNYKLVKDESGAYQVMDGDVQVAKQSILDLIDAEKLEIALDANKENLKALYKQRAEDIQNLLQKQQAFNQSLKDAGIIGSWNEEELTKQQYACTQYGIELQNAENKLNDTNTALSNTTNATALLTSIQNESDASWKRLGVTQSEFFTQLANKGYVWEDLKTSMSSTGIATDTFANMTDAAWAKIVTSYDGSTDSILRALGEYNATTEEGNRVHLDSMVTDTEAYKESFEKAQKENGKASLTGYEDGVKDEETRKNLFETLGKLFDLIIETVKKKLDSNSPSKVFKGIGEDTIQGYKDGVDSKNNDAVGSVGWLAGAVTKVMEGVSLVQSGINVIAGFIRGMKEKFQEALNNVRNFASNILETVKNKLKEGSPSKAMREIGINTIKGYEIGVDKEQGKALKQMSEFGDNILSSVSDMNLEIPSVTIDTANVDNAVATIDNQLSNQQASIDTDANLTQHISGNIDISESMEQAIQNQIMPVLQNILQANNITAANSKQDIQYNATEAYIQQKKAYRVRGGVG